MKQQEMITLPKEKLDELARKIRIAEQWLFKLPSRTALNLSDATEILNAILPTQKEGGR